MISILFIGKRFNTNRDALTEKFGRIYQLPYHLSKEEDITLKLWMVDYHTYKKELVQNNKLHIISTPVKNGMVFSQYLQENFSKNKYDIIMASGDCYIGLMAYLLAKSHKAKFVFDIYDKYDEFGGYIKPFGFDLFGFLLKKADIRLFASRILLQNLGQSQYDAILSNGIDAKHFRPIDKTEARTKLQLPLTQKFIGYFGSMEPDRGVQDLITAVNILRLQGQNVELLLGGKSDPSLDLDQAGIRYLGNAPFENIPYALAACDILAIPYRRSLFMDAGSSNKIAEAIVCQRPVVATRSPNLLANFPKQAVELEPYLAEPSNPESLARAIIKQLDQRHLVCELDNIYWDQISLVVIDCLKGLYDAKV